MTATSLNNVNVVSVDKLKTVGRKIDTSKRIKIRHGKINKPLKILILFIK